MCWGKPCGAMKDHPESKKLAAMPDDAHKRALAKLSDDELDAHLDHIGTQRIKDARAQARKEGVNPKTQKGLLRYQEILHDVSKATNTKMDNIYMERDRRRDNKRYGTPKPKVSLAVLEDRVVSLSRMCWGHKCKDGGGGSEMKGGHTPTSSGGSVYLDNNGDVSGWSGMMNGENVAIHMTPYRRDDGTLVQDDAGRVQGMPYHTSDGVKAPWLKPNGQTIEFDKAHEGKPKRTLSDRIMPKSPIRTVKTGGTRHIVA